MNLILDLSSLLILNTIHVLSFVPRMHAKKFGIVRHGASEPEQSHAACDG